ncbi:MAG: hypothetical protein ABIH21_04545 [Patescibacteria group bacterium]
MTESNPRDISFKNTAQTETRHALHVDFKLPDMSVSGKEDEFEIRRTVEIPLRSQGQEIKGMLTVEVVNNPEHKHLTHLGRIELEGFADSGERVLSFKSTLTTQMDDVTHQTTDRSKERFWIVHTRRIDKESGFRGKGFGELALRALEEAIKKLEQKLPELESNWIHVETRLSAIASLVIDPNWLKQWLAEHPDLPISGNRDRLVDRAEKERNLGYIPHPADIEGALWLLQRRTSDIDQIGGAPNVAFIKPTNPAFHPETEFKKNE